MDKKAVLLSFRLREMELQKVGHKIQPGGIKWIANLKTGVKHEWDRKISEPFLTRLLEHQPSLGKCCFNALICKSWCLC